MTSPYSVLASRIQQDLEDRENVLARIGRSTRAAQEGSAQRDLLIDSAALNLHDFYSGLERIFAQIASTVDKSLPSGDDWHGSSSAR